MDLNTWATLVIEQTADALECDYSDAEAVYLAQEYDMKNMFARCQTVEQAVNYLTK